VPTPKRFRISREIEASDVDEHSLGDVAVEAQVRASPPAGLEGVREASLNQLAALLHQTLAPRSVLPSPIRVHRFALGLLIFSVLPRTQRL
jgi:hypothetical protein